MSKNTAVVGGISDRCADIAAELEAGEARRKRGRGAARRSAWRQGEVPGIVGGSVDGVEGLPIGEQHGHVGLTEDDRSRREQAIDGDPVGRCDIVLVARNAPGGRPADEIVGFLNRHRDTVQRSPYLATGQRGIGLARTCARPIDIAYDDRVDRRIEPLHARPEVIEQLDAANSPGRYCGSQGNSRLKGNIGHVTAYRMSESAAHAVRGKSGSRRFWRSRGFNARFLPCNNFSRRATTLEPAQLPSVGVSQIRGVSNQRRTVGRAAENIFVRRNGVWPATGSPGIELARKGPWRPDVFSIVRMLQSVRTR